MKSTIILIFTSLLVFNCSQSEHHNSELSELFNKEKELHCLLTQMKTSISGEWDNVTLLLDEQLPSDMPTEERSNILKVRNANLIRMFESYHEMNDEIKQTLSDTEKHDQDMGSEILKVKKKLKIIEIDRMKLFENVLEEKGKKVYAELQELREKMLDGKCTKY